jgi:serine/threonine-protein kinase HipA
MTLINPNPNEYGMGLSLDITDEDNSLDLGLATSIASYLRLSKDKASQIIQKVVAIVKNWKKVAAHYKIYGTEHEGMAAAFIPRTN